MSDEASDEDGQAENSFPCVVGRPAGDSPHLEVDMHVYVCFYICLFVCMHAFMHDNRYTDTDAHICICTVCVCIYIYIYR